MALLLSFGGCREVTGKWRHGESEKFPSPSKGAPSTFPPPNHPPPSTPLSTPGQLQWSQIYAPTTPAWAAEHNLCSWHAESDFSTILEISKILNTAYHQTQKQAKPCPTLRRHVVIRYIFSANSLGPVSSLFYPLSNKCFHTH